MKKHLLIIAAALAFNVGAQDFRLVSGSPDNCEFTYTLKEAELSGKNVDNVSYVDFSGMYKVVSLEKGAPSLPVFHTSLLLPAKGNPVVTVEYDDAADIQDIRVLPSKGNLKRNVNPASVPYTFGEVYQSNAFYPSAVTSATEPFVWGSARGINIAISPYQYNPVTKTLRVHRSVRIKLDYNLSENGVNETAVSVIDPKFAAGQQKSFLNASVEKYTALQESGSLLVIAPASYEASLADFMTWKTMKGISAEFVTAETAGASATDIKAYIQSYYAAHPELMYILLVGDHEQIPAYSYGTSGDGEQLWSDSYYGQLAGGVSDFHPEVFVGRFPAANEAQAKLMADRSVEYERSPAAGNWMEKAIGIASDEGSGYGDDNEADYQHMRNLRSKLMTYGYSTVYEFYQGSQGGNDAAGSPNSTLVANAVNDGAGLLNYTGHGDANSFITSSYSSTAVNNATNNGMYPFAVSVACNNGTFAGANCLGEAFLRSENNGSAAGGIAFAGSSILMAWAPPMQTQDEMTEILTGAYPDNRKETIGGLFYNAQLSMLEQYTGTDGREVMQTWILFGDPTTGFRSKVPADLSASHVAQVPLATAALTVSCNVEGAVIAVSQDHQLIGRGTVSGGQAVISFNALTQEIPLTVIATKSNYRPYMGSVQVGNSTLSIEEANALFAVYPNPAKDQFTIASDVNAEFVEMYSLTGTKVVVSAEQQSGKTVVSTSGLAAGSYILKIGTASGVAVKRIEIVK